MPITSQKVPNTSPLTAELLTASINEVVGELFRRSFAEVQNPLGTNNYTGAVALDRPLEDGNGFAMLVPNTNTGACTFNQKPLVSATGADLQGGNLLADSMVLFRYHFDDDHYRVVTPLAGGAVPIVRVYTAASSTWTKPAGLRHVRVRVQGGGGGGGGSGNGTPGGASSFGAFVSAQGGGGGGFNNTVATATGGDVNIPGQAGGAGYLITTATARGVSGAGASSMMGIGGPSVSGTSSTTGLPGTGFGSGGGGGASGSGGNAGGGSGAYAERLIAPTDLPTTVTVTVGAAGGSGSGGAGGPGVVIVEEYY